MEERLPAINIQSLLNFLRPYVLLLWRVRRRIMIALGVETVIIITVILLFAKPYYECTVTILPDYGNKSVLGNVSQLASLAGVSVGDAAPTEIFENLLFAEAVLEPVFFTKYQTEKFQDSVNLLDYFEIEPDEDLPESLRERRRFLACYVRFTKNWMKTDLNSVTNVLDVQIRMPESKLSTDVVNRLAESLDIYVRTQRKSYASNQRYYLEMRLEQVRDSLMVAEEALKQFREQNTNINQSPGLLLSQTRRARNVDILQAVYVQLTQQLELTKIDEIRDAPVLNIKELAREPIEKAGPNRRLYAMILLFLAGSGTLTYFISKDIFRKPWAEVLKFKREVLAEDNK